MVIQQGDVFWLDSGVPFGSEAGFRRPYVVVQGDRFNRSRIGTAVVCLLSGNLRLAQAPGNVLLDEGEAGLPRRSVVNVSQVLTVDRARLEERSGTLSEARMREIFAGLCLLLGPE